MPPLTCERCGAEQQYEVCRACWEVEYAVSLFTQAMQNVFSSKAAMDRVAHRARLQRFYLSLAADGEENMARIHMGECGCGCGSAINFGDYFVRRGDRLYAQAHDPAGGERKTA